MINVKKFRIHIKYFGLLVLLSAICTIISCDRPIPFDKDKWVECGTFDGRCFIGTDDIIKDNTRYRMSLWLEENYNFCDKSLDDILENFYQKPEPLEWADSLRLVELLTNKILKITVKRYGPNWNTDELTITDWIEVHFDENYMVSKVYYVHYDYKTEKKTKREICNAA